MCLFQSKKAYDKASGEANQALNEYHKADKDMTLTKLQVEKVGWHPLPEQYLSMSHSIFSVNFF